MARQQHQIGKLEEQNTAFEKRMADMHGEGWLWYKLRNPLRSTRWLSFGNQSNVSCIFTWRPRVLFKKLPRLVTSGITGAGIVKDAWDVQGVEGVLDKDCTVMFVQGLGCTGDGVGKASSPCHAREENLQEPRRSGV